MPRELTKAELSFIKKNLLTIIKIANNKNMRSSTSRIDQMSLLAALAVDCIEEAEKDDDQEVS